MQKKRHLFVMIKHKLQSLHISLVHNEGLEFKVD